jgi:hypothetical protein
MVVHTHCVNGTLQLNTTTTHHAAMHIVECECWIMDVSNTPTLMHTIVFEGFHTWGISTFCFPRTWKLINFIHLWADICKLKQHKLSWATVNRQLTWRVRWTTWFLDINQISRYAIVWLQKILSSFFNLPTFTFNYFKVCECIFVLRILVSFRNLKKFM